MLPRLSSKGIQRISSLGWRFLVPTRRQWFLMLITETPSGRMPSSRNWSKYTTLILLNPLVLSTRHVYLLVTLKPKYILYKYTTTIKMVGIRHTWWPLVIRLGPISTLTIIASYHFVPCAPLSYYPNWITLRHVLVISVDLFQPKTDLFSTRSLIWMHFKTVHYFSQPIISFFNI